MLSALTLLLRGGRNEEEEEEEEVMSKVSPQFPFGKLGETPVCREDVSPTNVVPPTL